MFKPKNRVTIISVIIAILLFILTNVYAYAAEEFCGATNSTDEELITLHSENEVMKLKINQLESINNISADYLHHKKIERLKEIATDVNKQRHATSSFEVFVKWMTANIASYNSYIKYSSYASLVARLLPIPYAGQTAIFTKFITEFTVALNNASVAITRYLDSSQKFINMVNAIDPTKPAYEKAISEAAIFADKSLLKDMNDAQLKLTAVSNLSSGALSFLETVDQYVNNADEYWNKVKGMISKNVDPKEKSYLSESIKNLKTEANSFNGKLIFFESITGKEASHIKSLVVYDELLAELKANKIKG